MTRENQDKVAIITGGGSGLGHDITEAFCQAHYQVVITGRTEKTLAATVEDFRERYEAQIHYFVADGGEEDRVQEVVAAIVDKLGRIDVLINNAQAVNTGIALEDQTLDDFRLAINSGLYGTFNYMKACFPYLKESKGSIINMGSGAGITGMAGFASYAATKEAIRGLTRVAATEWSQYGINTNAICPAVLTPAFEEWSKEHPEEYQAVLASVPARQFPDGATHVGGTCLYLASPAGKMITGRTLDVDGGQNQRP
ncbi:SDR family oxidoreductase [Aerococcus sp. UMB7834]|uniref:SDR family NAD(P)-dependent oxidoreductase n=1 Tax=Aerococcus sp. UMB7834 TaxID=3046342 RepID=UPI00254DB9AF|nr:SDR family oxidoreductase [Aerococcus sp. UMB7834]MDK6805452.1 SDR family oxidoreductase [Aerococcus sp. UMB7834]